jgi:hypothetical protein
MRENKWVELLQIQKEQLKLLAAMAQKTHQSP